MQGDNDSVEGSTDDYIAESETDDFVWEDFLEEISKFENFNVDMTFTRKRGSHSLSLQLYLGETHPEQSLQ
jgi:hypothetical protein